MQSSFETMEWNYDRKFETMELILMSVLPEYKHHQLLQNIDLKPSLAREKNVVKATEDIESNGTKYHQDKKNVSLARNLDCFLYCILNFLTKELLFCSLSLANSQMSNT